MSSGNGLVSKQAMLRNLRMSKYQPIYAEMLVTWMSEGRRFKAFAGHPDVRVDFTTLETWAELHEEFATAREIGEAASLAYWEQEFVAKASGSEELDKDDRRIGSGHWEAMKFTGKNAHPDDFKEKVEVGHTGSLSFVVDTGIDRTPIDIEGRVVTDVVESVNVTEGVKKEALNSPMDKTNVGPQLSAVSGGKLL